jgi:hypothetical protein
MEPVTVTVTTFFLSSLLGSVAVEGSIGAVKGAIQTLLDADNRPGERAAQAFVTCFVSVVGLGLVATHPITVAKFLWNVSRISFNDSVRDPEDPSKPRSVTMEVAKEVI